MSPSRIIDAATEPGQATDALAMNSDDSALYAAVADQGPKSMKSQSPEAYITTQVF